MIDQASERHPLDLIAEEFTERLRRGEEPSVDEYATGHPELAEEIHELFPTIQEMERLKRTKERSGDPLRLPEGLRLERLGDYRIIHEIGRGGMGIVYEAEQESLGRRVAIKVLPGHLLPDSKQYQRFDREARTAARLHHTNIVPVFGVGQQDGFHYYVMQYIDGVGLDEVLRVLERADGGRGRDGEASGAGPDARTARRAGQAAGIARALLSGRWSLAGDPADSVGPAEVPIALEEEVPAAAGGTAPRRAPSDTVVVPRSRLEEPPAEPVPPRSREAAPAPRPVLRLQTGYWRCVAGIGLQAASGLQYAHSQGTLHRDIKPANLLLDSRGFVWVGDFGLAKPMADQPISQTGDVVGTLRYMAPEQLAGEAEERSDVYCLGLTLYELATLRPAYRESDTKRLLRAITDGHIIRPRKIRPEIPPDLETIILKSIAREPAHRYRSAGDLRVDLQRFLDDLPIRARRIGAAGRLWRWSKRNRALAAVGGTALTLLVLLAAVATAGYLETRKAWEAESRSFRVAQKTLGNIFDQFAPDRSLPTASLTLGETDGENEGIEAPNPPVLSRSAAKLLEHLLNFYDLLADQKGEDVALREKVAEASRRVGDIRQRLGSYEEARTAYRRALEVYQALEEKSPGDAGLRIAEAKIDNELGGLSREMRESGRAFHQKALAILLATSPDESTSREFRYELARTHYFLGKGDLFGPPGMFAGPERRKGRPAAQVEKREEPREEARDEKRQEKRDEKRDEKRGPFPRGRGPQDWERFQKELKEQRESLETAIRLLTALLAEDPRVPDYRQLLARAYRAIGLSWTRQAEDRPALEEAVKILEKLVLDYPNIPDYRYDLSKMYADIGSAPGPSEDSSKEAIESLEKALAIAEALVADHPQVPAYASSEVDWRLRLSRAFQGARQFQAAETNLEKALEAQSTLVRRNPEVPSFQVRKAEVLGELAVFFQGQHRPEEAWFAVSESISILETLLGDGASGPQESWVRSRLFEQLRRLSEVLVEMGDEAGAEEAWERADKLNPRRQRERG